MEFNVSPLIKKEQNAGVTWKPFFDDTYAYITNIIPLTRHDYYYIERKIEQGWITERDIEIIKFVFVHRWATVSQLARLFFSESEREKNKTADTRLKKMMKFGLLRKIQWSSYVNPQKNRPSIYEMGASGADVLKYRFGMALGHRDPRTPKPTTMLYRLKYIVTNELYIQLRENFNMVHFEFHPILTLKEEQQIPTAKYVLRNPKGKDMTFYLQVHRDDEKWLKTLRYQAQFYKRYLGEVEKGATLVILVSTAEKAELAHKVFEQEDASEFVWYLTDEELFSNEINLTQAFFVFQNMQKVYYDLH